MKLLFITNYPSPYRVDFFNKLGAKCEVTVLFEQNTKEQSHRSSEWFNENYLNFNAIFLKKTKVFKKFNICFDINNYLEKDKFDVVVHCNYATLTGMYAIYNMKRKKIKFAIEADGGLSKNKKGFKEKLKHKLISSASYWISSSKVTDEYFIKYGAVSNNIYRYPFTSISNNEILNWNITKEEKTVIKNKLGINYEKYIISVGRFSYGKGFDVLIKAMSLLPRDYGVFIIGGEATEEYIELKKKYNLENIHFINFKKKDELIEYYKAADLFVLPTRGDAWGLVINEAMACGLPIITTKACIAGLELITDYENGFITDTDDEVDFANKISLILSDDELREKISDNNLNKIKKYTIENMVDKHIEIFEDIVSRK